MSKKDVGILSLLAGAVLILIGMFAASWKLILYPYFVMVGIILAIGLGKILQQTKHLIIIPLVSSAMFIILFMLLDANGWTSATGGGNETKYFLGLVPTTFIYLVFVSSTVILLSFLYIWGFSYQNKIEIDKNRTFRM
jgi:MFS superfamily sulfate permease-like transporter